MPIFDYLKLALRSMRSNKLRTILTMLGIVIGISSVVIVFSAGAGLRGLLVSQVESFGTDIIQTEVKVPTNKKGAAGDSQSSSNLAEGVQVTSLKISDMEDVKKLSNVSGAYASIMSQERVSYLDQDRKAFMSGVSASFINIDRIEIAEGRFFSDEEDKALSSVVVLGSKMKDKLFGDSEALDKYITIRKEKFRVVGVLKERGAVMGMDFDDFVYLPIRTLQKKLMGVDYVSYFVSQVYNVGDSANTAEQIREILRLNHNISDPIKDDFRVSTMADMMKILDTVTSAITWLLLAIVVISLIVGGVGILNVMYVIVSERTMEIGLRKAVGANYSQIMGQFLTEAVVISVVGGLTGMILGTLISFLLALGARYFGLDWVFSVPIKAYIISFSFALIFGIAFGVYPAKRAAKMEPVEALRKE